nr:hypothetical protein [Candidatus Njordarchaeum guaymaensis]
MEVAREKLAHTGRGLDPHLIYEPNRLPIVGRMPSIPIYIRKANYEKIRRHHKRTHPANELESNIKTENRLDVLL